MLHRLTPHLLNFPLASRVTLHAPSIFSSPPRFSPHLSMLHRLTPHLLDFLLTSPFAPYVLSTYFHSFP
ncbi:MAG: hypothetical protein KTR25_07310 [Myxococcales bacterium]|nr:hypothetical protein [Myxococcales bacterium]